MPNEPYSRRAPRSRRRAAVALPSPRRHAGSALWFALLLFALLLLAVLLPEPAGAQITTGLTPPERTPPPEVVARAESTIAAARDSAAREERLDLKAWVDSAAQSLEAGADPVTPGIPGDSAAPRPGQPVPPGQPVRPGQPRPAPGEPRPPTTTYRPGAPAPDTATPLPLLVAAGGAMAGAGVWLRRRR